MTRVIDVPWPVSETTARLGSLVGPAYAPMLRPIGAKRVAFEGRVSSAGFRVRRSQAWMNGKSPPWFIGTFTACPTGTRISFAVNLWTPEFSSLCAGTAFFALMIVVACLSALVNRESSMLVFGAVFVLVPLLFCAGLVSQNVRLRDNDADEFCRDLATLPRPYDPVSHDADTR